MSEQHYHGGCQCGAVQYEVDVDISEPIRCNCSRCKPMGFLLAFTPLNNFQLLSGDDNLTEYLFNKKQIQHRFCTTCGVQSFAFGKLPDGTEMAAVNVNCLQGVDPREIDASHHDGKNA